MLRSLQGEQSCNVRLAPVSIPLPFPVGTELHGESQAMKLWDATEPFYKYALLRDLRRNEWMSPQQLADLQIRRLRSLLIHAYANIPYYRRLFDSAGFKPSAVSTLGDFQKIPITTKETMRQRPLGDITASAVNQELIRTRTSGSSGILLSVYQTQKEIAKRVALITRGNLAVGVRWRDKKLTIRNPRSNRKTLSQRLGFFPEQAVSVFAEVQDQVSALYSYRPDILSGYPSSLEEIARNLDENKRGRLPLRLIICGGEVLFPRTRQILENNFECRLIDAYGAEEIGRIAVQCLQSSGLHVNADAVIIEIIRDGQPVAPGQEGQIVATSLTSYAMPFIRYQLDDLGVMEPSECACGRSLPMLTGLTGRSDDLIRLPNGVFRHPISATSAFLDIVGIAGFQVIQEREDQFKILLEQENGFTENTIPVLEGRLRERLGNFNFEFELVARIQRESSGKQRRVISRVS